MTDKEVEKINNYSPMAEVIIGESIHRDEVEVNIPRLSPSLRRIIVLLFLHKILWGFLGLNLF
jgi:hypothetical protein